MIPVKPPPLIPSLNPLGHDPGLTQDCFRALFQYLYVEAHWYATVPRCGTLKVTFLPHHFGHAFFKEPDKGQPREVWRPDRAERLLWVGYTVENPSEVYQVGSSRFNLFCRMAAALRPGTWWW